MSSAHRPTWAPAQGKEGRQNSKVYSSRDLAAHTKLKFRQPGQGTHQETTARDRRDLKLELLQAERESDARKNKGERGLVVDRGLKLLSDKDEQDRLEKEHAKRRKLLQDVADLDKDDEDDDDDEEESTQAVTDKGAADKDDSDNDDEDEDDDDDDDDDEDETAELLRELEKIKRERAEERERQVQSSLSS